MQIAIAGAGIAGLTSAIALAERGLSVRVFERAAELKEIGAGIQLAPNATGILQELGILAALADRVSEPDALTVRSMQSGELFFRMPLGATVRARYGAPYLTLHRADLQAALLAAARERPAISLRLGAETRNVTQRDDAVSFEAAGTRHQSEALVGADGVHSAIRRTMFGYPGPLSLQRRAWRAILPIKDVPPEIRADEVGLWLGSGCHMVHYAVNGGRGLNVVVIAPVETDDPRSLSLEGAARRLATASVGWEASGLFVVDPTRPNADRRVALIGDAAHAMSPSAAQGGAMAIEDAYVLATALSNTSHAQAALAKYAQARQGRTVQVARLSARNLNLYEAWNVPAFARNSALRVLGILPATLLLSRLDWLFGWKPDWLSRNANRA